VGSNTIVMMEWERPYMEACVDALKISPSDSVLEIGFGYSLFVCRHFLGRDLDIRFSNERSPPWFVQMPGAPIRQTASKVFAPKTIQS
jgi:hypothetical protein